VAELDHLVYRVPELAPAVERFARRTGVWPVRGGSHVGRGTANHLVGLGRAAYLEIIGPDPTQPDFVGERPFGVAPGIEPGLVTWAVRTEDIDAAIQAAREHGYDPGAATAMHRALPGGGRLQWRLSGDAGLLPFLIDWDDGPHPTDAGLPQLLLVEFTIVTPDVAQLRDQLAALQVEADVEPGDPALRAVIDTPRGRITLS
jgi:hypothetical protein